MLDRYFFSHHLEDDEQIQMIVHRHWLLGARMLLWPTGSLGLSMVSLALRHGRGGLVFGGLWAAISVVWWIRNFLDYYLDAWVITNHGVIDLEWLGWFHRQSARILYSDIQGISYEIHGIPGTVLRYGTVAIEKISTGSTVSIAQVPSPRKIESEVLRNMETYLHSKNLKNAKHIEELLSTFVASHINEESFGKGKKATVASEERSASSRPTKKAFSSSRVDLPRA